MVVALSLVAPIFPALLLLALLIDVARFARTLSTVRLTLFLLAFLIVENVGLALLFFTFVTTRAGTRARMARTFAIQRLYTAAHLNCVRAIFSLRFVIQDSELARAGPFVALVRHASLVDVLVPGAFIANVHKIELRYVLKKELLAEPCLDLAGHWIPNHFVSRSGEDTQRELDAIRALKTGIGANSGVLVFPEGTRFSARKREKLLTGPDAERAKTLKHLLPVRPGGTLALLDAEPECDLIFIGHHGLEGLSGLKDIWRGKLVGRTITVKFWREAPPHENKLAFVDACWKRLDDWLETFE